MADHEHVVSTGKGTIGLDELGAIQPGMARIMTEVGVRAWKCYYAGKARNRPLARFQLKEAVNLMRTGVIVRPQYGDDIAAFVAREVEAVRQAIEAGDWDTFEEAFGAMVEEANRYHAAYHKPFLRWKIPEMPPPDLDMTPDD